MSDSDVERIEHEIEQTRAELAGTVEALAYKADVPARAKEKAAATAERAKEKATAVSGQAKEKATAVSGQAREKATAVGGQAREKATVVGGQAKEKAGHAVHSAQEAPPKQKAGLAAGLAGVAAAIGSVWYLVRRRRS